MDHFSDSQCLEFLAQSDLHLRILYQPTEVQIATRTIAKLGVTLPHWHIAPSLGETLAFVFLRDLHSRFQVLHVEQENGYTKIGFTAEQRIDLYQTSFGLPSWLSFTTYPVKSHYSRTMRKLNRKTTGV